MFLKHKNALLTIVAFGFAAVLAPALFAEDPPSYSLGEKLLGIPSGWFGILTQSLIILTSIFLFGWIIECFVNVRRDKLVAPETIAALQNYIDEGDLEGALQYCESAPNMLTRTIGAGLNKVQSGPSAVKDAASFQFSIEGDKLDRHLGPITVCVAIGPMMGLFGTVTGMVDTFATIENAPGGQVNPKMVSGGIALALLSTVVGLVIAIPGIVAYWFFKNRANDIVNSVSLVVDEMLETIAGYAAQQQG
ncbi:MAG: MotA/TolQ/ExbB proton channel family protein [Planctomycetes bacterium]|jgi:biopolymer transport protein ExbB|nr:MotA/TolQ/ExbB proton channel family protein [Planctomycetota bacterium]